MRKTVIALLALGLLAAMAAPAGAVSFWSEKFDYADGGLVAVSGGNWIGHYTSTLTTYMDIQVQSGVAVYNGAKGQDDSRTFPEQSASATTYAAFKMKVVGTALTGTVYVAHFKNTGTYFRAQTYVIGTGTSTYSVGISSTSALSATWPTPLNCDTWYNVVISHNASTDLSKLWVNPTTESSPSITSGVGGGTGTLLAAFALRQATPGNIIHFDNIGAGDTFTDAFTSGPTPVEGTTWGKLKALYR